uniref:Uncharacterized protein n=1 Tax=Fagus sylvatica TaxID=28930 RepID=A0A2N9FZN4_FAGSY
MEDTDMLDRPKEKDRVLSSDSGEHFGLSFEDDGANPNSEPSSPVRVRSDISHKDSLVGVIPGAYENAFFGSNMEEDGGDNSDEDDDDEHPEEGEVVIKFPRC